MGRTVVHWAAGHSASTLKDLSNEAAFAKAVAVQDESGCSPLAIALREANFESAKILMGSAATTIPGGAPLLTVLSGLEYSEALGNYPNINLNIQDADGQTPLHLAVSRDIGCVVALLSYGADVNAKDKNGHNALMKAVQAGYLDLVKLLLLFDADLKAVDAQGQSVYEINKTSKRRADIDILLADMNPPAASASPPPTKKKRLGAEFLSSFDWLAGTSTGAILALALSQGKSIPFCRSMYFRLKDEIFCGDRPYSALILDSFLRSEFGENTTMADLTKKNVMVTACVANVCPPQLQLLRSYQLETSEEEN
ncbi:unnamed protein product, partial [Strongylus vulgaris]